MHKDRHILDHWHRHMVEMIMALRGGDSAVRAKCERARHEVLRRYMRRLGIYD